MRTRHSDRNYGKPLYVEVIRWSPLLSLFVLFLDASVVLAIWAALPGMPTWLTIIFLSIATLAAFKYSTLKITVTQGWLIVGPAAIERAFIHNFKALNSSEMKRERGIGAHPLNYLQLRAWYSTGIKADLRDPRDKTTSWIFTSRNSEKLVSVLANPDH